MKNEDPEGTKNCTDAYFSGYTIQFEVVYSMLSTKHSSCNHATNNT
ncbi:MAG: hypothetical protein U5M51_12990 [Emticicia sp.]|nr:hypothetical protein [Emticicia sp.]